MRKIHYELKKQREKIECELCKGNYLNRDLHQHRINPKGTYEDSNVMIICKDCHHMIHKFIRQFKDYKMAIEMVKCYLIEEYGDLSN